jgi:hypothetical protein
LFLDLTSFQVEESRNRNITFDFTWCMTLVFQVAVRCRPLSAKENRDILRVVDGKVSLTPHGQPLLSNNVMWETKSFL